MKILYFSTATYLQFWRYLDKGKFYYYDGIFKSTSYTSNAIETFKEILHYE